MATERIDIIVQEKGSRTVKRNLEEIGTTAKDTGRSVDYAGRAIAGLGAAFGVAKLIEYADTMTAIESRLRLVTNSTQALARVQGNLFDLAQRTRQSFSGTTELYAKLAKGTEELALGEAKLLKVTETVNKTMVLSGTSAQGAQAALLQFGQGLSAGALRGEELNSILEQAPRLAQALADGLGVPVGALKKLGEQGELTADKIIFALTNQASKINSEFDQITPTIGQAFQVLNNELVKFIGTGAQTSGVAGTLAGAILLVSKNLDLITAAAIGFAGAKLAQLIAETTVAVYSSITATLSRVAAEQAERAATLASAQAEAVRTGAVVRDTEAKVAQIAVIRAVTVAELAQINTTIASAQAQIAASRSAGALSFALASLRTAEASLAAAMATRAALTTELAALGTAQAAATAAQTAATTAAAGATGALVAAQGAAATSGRILAGVVGLLGGPIGAIATVLGLGVTAWLAWGSTSRSEADKTAGEIKRSTGEIVGDLDRQIVKLQERNRLAQTIPSLGQSGGEPVQRLAELQKKIDDFQSGVGESATMTEAARQAVLQVTLRQYGELYGKIQTLNAEQEKFTKIGQESAKTTWLKKYATDAERLNAELSKAKKELGDAFTPDIEKRIRESFNKKGSTAKKDNPYADEVKSLQERAAMVGLNTEVEKVMAEVSLGKFGKLSFEQEKELRILAERIDSKNKEIEQDKTLTELRRSAAAQAAQEEAAARREVETTRAGNQSLRDEIEAMGANEQAKTLLEKIRLSSLITLKEEQLALGLAAEGYTTQNRGLESQIELLRERQNLLEKKGERQADLDAQEASEKITKAAQESEKALADSISNGLLEGFRKGETIADVFLRELKSQFAKTVLTPLIQPVVSAGNDFLKSIIGGISGALSGAATPTAPVSTGSQVMYAATGTNYVPYDNYPALLHKGEAVVPEAYNPAAGGVSAQPVVNFSPIYQIDARSDRAAVRQDMVEITRRSQEELVQELRDSGMIA